MNDSASFLHKIQSTICPPAVGAGAGDRGAAATGGLPEHDPGPQPPGHGAQRSLHRGGVPRRVSPAPQQGVSGGKQASQRCPAQRSGMMPILFFISVCTVNKTTNTFKQRQAGRFRQSGRDGPTDNHRRTIKERYTSTHLVQSVFLPAEFISLLPEADFGEAKQISLHAVK